VAHLIPVDGKCGALVNGTNFVNESNTSGFIAFN